ncbi:MAG: hypothetical protein HFJ44_02330 [Clostridia bacterium]|jgi:hypothetical protein|nr:hypothetical protein [Clostridia bacterium]
MAMNPMQRKVRNSFLFGFIVALLIGAVIIGLLIMKNKQAQEEIVKIQEANKLAMTEVYVTEKDVKAGEPISATTVSLPAQSVPENALKAEDLENYLNDDGEYEMLAKFDMKEKTALTPDMIDKSKSAATYRMVEYNMISLPSMLTEGNYIDIRLACLGLDTVVLSKVEVESANATTIWLKLSESQLLTLNYAIVESYVMDGTKLYATVYTDNTQPALNCTYIPAANVISLVQANVDEDGKELEAFYERQNDMAYSFRNEIIGKLKGADDDISEEVVEKITEGYQTEKSSIQAARDALLGDIGY